MTPDEQPTPRQREIKEQLEGQGLWSSSVETALAFDEEYLARYAAVASYSYDEGALDPRVRELILLAVNSAVTHLYRDGIRLHVRNALEEGATAGEIMEVFEIVSVLGIHSMSIGVEVLIDVAGYPDDDERDQSAESQLKKEFADYWPNVWSDIGAFDPEYLRKFTKLSTHPWQHGELAPEVKEYAYIAIDVSTTHLYKSGLRFHVENALENTDATRREVLEVVELVSLIGTQSVFEGANVLAEEIERRD